MSEKQSFSIEILNEKHVEAASVCLCQCFTKEPMVKALGASFEEVLGSFTNVVKKSAKEGASLVAIEESTGAIAGVCINKDFTFNPVEDDEDFSEAFFPIFALLDELNESASQLEGAQVGEVLHCFMLAVSEIYKSNKLGYRMTQRSCELSAEQGFKQVIMEATGGITQYLAETKFGFYEIGSIDYRSFVYEEEKVFSDIDEVQTCKLLLKDV